MPLEIFSNGSAYGTSPASAGNGNNSIETKWMSFQENMLDGSFKLLPTPAAQEMFPEVGWWSNILSDSSGVLPTEAVLTIDEYRWLKTIQLHGYEALGEYPVDFKIELWSTDRFGTPYLYKEYDIVGNQSVDFSMEVDTHGMYHRIVYRFYKINKANHSVRLAEARPNFIQTLADESYITSSETLSIGILPALVQDQAPLPSEEAVQIQNTISPKEYDVGIVGAEAVHVDNIYTAFDASQRAILGRVEITYSDPFNDESIEIVASDTAYNTDAAELADSITQPAFKWFSLNDNTLDGSYHPVPGNKEYSVGWWSNVIADAQGVFTTPPSIVITFTPRTLDSLRIVGDALLNSIPVHFKFNLYNEAEEVIYTQEVTDNTQIEWSSSIGAVADVAKLEVIIYKTNHPGTNIKLTEMFTAVTEVYENDLLQSMHLLEEIGYQTGSLPIGNVSSNEIDIVISNADRRFDLHNVHSKLYGFVKRNRRVRAWLGAQVAGEITWVPLGTFWTTAWDIPKDELVTTLTARDRLELLRLNDIRAPIFVNANLYQLFEYVLLDAGVTNDQFVLDPALTTITIPYAWFDNMSHREALARLAGCGIVQVYCLRDGRVNVNLHLDTTPHVVHVFDDDVNVLSSTYPLAVTEQVNYVEVVSKEWVPVSGAVVLYENTEEILLEAGQSLTQTIQFDYSPVLSIEPPVLDADVGIVVEGYTLYATGMTLQIKNNGTSSGSMRKVTISGIYLHETNRRTLIAQDESLIKADGKISVSLEHDFIQRSSYAQELADTILSTYKASRYDVTLENRGNAAVRLGDKVLVKDATYIGNDNNNEYMVARQQFTWAGYLTAITEGKKL